MPDRMPPASLIPDEPRLGVPEIVQSIGLARTTVLKIIATGELRAIKVGKRWFTYRSWINEYLLAQQNVADCDEAPRLNPIVIPNSEEAIRKGLARHGIEY